MTYSELILSLGEVKQFVERETKKQVSKTTLFRWMREILDLPVYDPSKVRVYTIEDAVCLSFWAISSEKAKKGSRHGRRNRRIQYYEELFLSWQRNQSID